MLNRPITRETVFAEVRSELLRVIAKKPREAAPITEEANFSELNVSSLELAEVISNLEATFDVDPFAEQVSITSIRSVGDVCDAYLLCLDPTATVAAGADTLDAELHAVRARTLDRKG
jgi:acyl carrier protein